MMTPSELSAIEARSNAATPGPWATWPKGEEGRHWAIAHDAEGNPAVSAAPCSPEDLASEEVDYAFVAHARSDVPALVAEVRRLQDENNRLTNLALDRREDLQGQIINLRDECEQLRAERNEAVNQRDRVLDELGMSWEKFSGDPTECPDCNISMELMADGETRRCWRCALQWSIRRGFHDPPPHE